LLMIRAPMLGSLAVELERDHTRSPEILLVDDETPVLNGLRRAISALRPHWHIHVAENGDEAVRYLQHEPCDLVVTDLEMPGLDGLGLLGWIQREFPNVARLVHSSSLVWPANEIASVAQDALRKPARPAEVVHAIERALDGLHAELPPSQSQPANAVSGP